MESDEPNGEVAAVVDELLDAWVAAEWAINAAQRAEGECCRALRSLRVRPDVRMILLVERGVLKRQLEVAGSASARGVLEAAIRRVTEAVQWIERMGDTDRAAGVAREDEAARERLRESLRQQCTWLEDMRQDAEERIASLLSERVENLELAEKLCAPARPRNEPGLGM